MNLILASSSKYRKELLSRWSLSFTTYSPDIIENIESKLSSKDNAIQLSKLKVEEVLKKVNSSIVIGSDQICEVGGKILGKPGNFDAAFEQLKICKNQVVKFFTGLCVFDPKKNKFYNHCDETKVHFRNLQDFEIKNYLLLEEPYHCAGSFKVESMGNLLFKKVISEDPTALIGLPMIKLAKFLRHCGINPLGEKVEQ